MEKDSKVFHSVIYKIGIVMLRVQSTEKIFSSKLKITTLIPQKN